MKSWAASQGYSSKFNLSNHRYLILVAFITVGVSAQIATPAADLPTNQQVLGFLTQSIDWYRYCAIERQIASDPADLVFFEDNRPRAAQIVQLSFDFARANAQFSTSKADSRSGIAMAAGSPDLAQFLTLQNNTESQARQASDEIQAIEAKLKSAHGVQQRELQAALDATKSRLAVLQAGLATLGELADFVKAFTGHESGDLGSGIEDLARSVPDVTSPIASPSPTQSLSLPVPSKPGDSGILALSTEVSALGRKLRVLDDEIRRTNSLRQSADELRKPLVTSLNNQLPAVLVNSFQATDLAELQQQKTKLDSLAILVKALSPAIVALDKQRVLLGAYTSHLKSWRTTVIAEDKKTWIKLLTRLLGAAVAIAVLLILGAVVRKITRRHMGDTEHRHVILVIQRVLLWATIVFLAAFAFASDFTSLATFFGLLAAGIAVAAQNVIVAALGYFVLVGRRGIRIGDRLEISGFAGDVTDMGWLQFQLREIDKGTQQPTGRTVTFSNSLVFISPAVGLSKFNRADLKPAQLGVAANSSSS
jgi:mechanosensitive ion channel-like protein